MDKKEDTLWRFQIRCETSNYIGVKRILRSLQKYNIKSILCMIMM